MIVAMNHENHTKEELKANADDAAYAYDDATNTYIAAAEAAIAVAYDDAKTIRYAIAKYFEITGEDKALYEAEIKRINRANDE